MLLARKSSRIICPNSSTICTNVKHIRRIFGDASVLQWGQIKTNKLINLSVLPTPSSVKTILTRHLLIFTFSRLVVQNVLKIAFIFYFIQFKVSSLDTYNAYILFIYKDSIIEGQGVGELTQFLFTVGDVTRPDK